MPQMSKATPGAVAHEMKSQIHISFAETRLDRFGFDFNICRGERVRAKSSGGVRQSHRVFLFFNSPKFFRPLPLAQAFQSQKAVLKTRAWQHNVAHGLDLQ
jgi:hypothetical protein